MKKKNIKDVIDELLYEAIIGKNPFEVGDLVKLRPYVLGRHSQSVPAHAGYTKNQFSWRETLKKLEDKTGKITRVFPNSKSVNVEFPENWTSRDEYGREYTVNSIGIDYTELVPANNPEREIGEGAGWGMPKDIAKDPKHTKNKTTGKNQKWTVKFDSAKDINKHGYQGKSPLDETVKFSDIKNIVNSILKEIYNQPNPAKQYIIWAKSGPVTVYYYNSPSQGEKMIQNGQSMAYRFDTEEQVRTKIAELKQKYKGIDKWDFESVAREKKWDDVWKPHGPKEFPLGHRVFKPVKKGDEWIVRWSYNGKTQPNYSYYSDNQKDALDTYALMLRNAEEMNRKGEPPHGLDDEKDDVKESKTSNKKYAIYKVDKNGITSWYARCKVFGRLCGSAFFSKKENLIIFDSEEEVRNHIKELKPTDNNAKFDFIIVSVS